MKIEDSNCRMIPRTTFTPENSGSYWLIDRLDRGSSFACFTCGLMLGHWGGGRVGRHTAVRNGDGNCRPLGSGKIPGLVTNSILFCWHFKIKDQRKKVRFQQSHNQGLRQLLFTVSWELHTPDGVHVSLWFRKQCPRRVEGPLKGATSAQKALQGSEMETRQLLGKEKSVSPTRGHWLTPQGNQ